MLGLFLAASLLAASPLPYEVASPPTGKEEALVIALHGALSSASFYCGPFMGGKLPDLAKDRKYIVVCPGGTGIRPRYENYEERLLETRKALLSQYPSIRKVYLMGHSLGGRGALLVGLQNPEKFDGIAAIAPALKLRKDKNGSVDAITELLKQNSIPVFFGWGIKDILIPYTPVDIASLTLSGHGLLELHPYNATHLTVTSRSLEDVFDFFDRCQGNVKLVRDVRNQ